MIERDGRFMAAEPWKCKHCRGRKRKKRAGTEFIVYTSPGEDPWVGCIECAGFYTDLVGRPAAG